MRRVLPLVLVALLAATAACSGGDGDDEAGSTSTSAPDTTAVIEVTTAPPATEPVPPTTIERGSPRTVTTQATALGPGTARILGTVNGPEGPITGAVIKVERFVGDAVAVADLRSQGGAWALDAILGGSYRVTIYRPPDLAQAAVDVFFLGADETKTLTTMLIRLGENSVTAQVDPNPPLLGQPALLTVRFGSGGVDGDGRIITTPRPGIRVQLNIGPGALLESAPVVFTDGNGAVAWQLRCIQPGQVLAAVVVGNASSSVILPPCAAPPPPEAAPPTTEP